MSGHVLVHSCKFHLLSATGNAAYEAAVDIPASGSYLDVSPYERVHIIAQHGAIHASDEPTLQPKCSDAVGGTADVLSATLVNTVSNDNDNEQVVWTIEVSSLPTDHHFLLVDVAGTTANGSYGSVILLGEVKSLPAIQLNGTLPTASTYSYAAGAAISSVGDDDA